MFGSLVFGIVLAAGFMLLVNYALFVATFSGIAINVTAFESEKSVQTVRFDGRAKVHQHPV